MYLVSFILFLSKHPFLQYSSPAFLILMYTEEIPVLTE